MRVQMRCPSVFVALGMLLSASSVEGECFVRDSRRGSLDHDNVVFEFFAAGPHHAEFCHFDVPLDDLDDVEAAEHLRQTAVESGEYAAKVVNGMTGMASIDNARRRTLQALRLALREHPLHPTLGGAPREYTHCAPARKVRAPLCSLGESPSRILLEACEFNTEVPVELVMDGTVYEGGMSYCSSFCLRRRPVHKALAVVEIALKYDRNPEDDVAAMQRALGQCGSSCAHPRATIAHITCTPVHVAESITLGPTIDVTVMMNVYGRPGNFGLQLADIFRQTRPPRQVWICIFASPFVDYFEGVIAALPAKFRERVRVFSSDFNLKFFGRFQLALAVKTEFVYFLDDDILLHPSALETWHGMYTSAVASNGSALNAIITTTGVEIDVEILHHFVDCELLTSARTPDGELWSYGHFPVTWFNRNVSLVEVDYSARHRFFRSEWLPLMFKESPPTLETFEDFWLSYTLKKFGGIRTLVACEDALLPPESRQLLVKMREGNGASSMSKQSEDLREQVLTEVTLTGSATFIRDNALRFGLSSRHVGRPVSPKLSHSRLGGDPHAALLLPAEYRLKGTKMYFVPSAAAALLIARNNASDDIPVLVTSACRAWTELGSGTDRFFAPRVLCVDAEQLSTFAYFDQIILKLLNLFRHIPSVESIDASQLEDARIRRVIYAAEAAWAVSTRTS